MKVKLYCGNNIINKFNRHLERTDYAVVKKTVGKRPLDIPRERFRIGVTRAPETMRK